MTSLTPGALPVLDGIRQWFDSDLGQHVLGTESAMLEQLLPGFFGYHLAQFSVQGQSLFDSSHIQHKFCVGLDNQACENLVVQPSQLPLASDSIDVAIVHHLLDFADSPQEVLREISRVTMPMGHIVLVGFNPLSLWGLWKTIAGISLNGKRSRAPWNGEFIRPGRLMDWFNLLNFKIDRAQYAIHRPPLAQFAGSVDDYSGGVSRNLNLPTGSVYVIVAQKHVGSIRPVRPVWKPSPAFGGLSVVQSSVKHDGPGRKDF